MRVITHQNSEYQQSVVEEDFVNFTVGQPSPRLLNLPQFQAAAKQSCVDITEPLLLQYGCQKGYQSFRQDLAAWLTSNYGFTVEPDDLLLTNGNSHATQFLIRTLCKRGELLLMDDPTYFLVGDIVKAAEVDVAVVSSRPDKGLNVDALEQYLLTSESRKPAALYMIPMHQNPTGASISERDARKLVNLAQEHDFYIIADEPYPLLNFKSSSAKTSSLKKYEEVSSAESKVISMGTFSKIIAPGLRLGWLHCSRKLIESRLASEPVLLSGGGFNPIVASIVHQLLKSHVSGTVELDKILNNLNEIYDERCTMICKTLDSLFNADGNRIVEYVQPQGGYFLWVKFLDGTMTEKFREYLLSKKDAYRVVFLHGNRCKVDTDTFIGHEGDTQSRFNHHMRLSWAFYEADELEEGVKRLHRGWLDFKKES